MSFNRSIIGVAIASLVVGSVLSAVAQTSSSNIKKTVVARGLEHPWSMAWLPDGAILITERPGRLRILRNGILDPKPIAEFKEALVAGQAGLMEVSLHPQFSTNRLIYFTYSAGTTQANRTVLMRAKFDGKTLSNRRVIFEVSPIKSGTQHFGSRLTWLPDGTLLMAIGDGGNPPLQLQGDLIRKQAQNLKSYLGKIVRLNDDGSIPKNPFGNAANPAIWTYGHRNIQGLTIDSARNRVWSTEHGSKGGDELNLIEGGKNYGWPLVTFSKEYTGGEISKETTRAGLTDPKLQWTPSIAPSGLVVYRNSKFPNWQGNIFAGGLVSQNVVRITVDNQGKVLNQQPIEIGQRVRDVRQGKDGFLYVLTDEDNGELIRLEPGT
jgi:aldose sugar dehydrogenase